MTDSITARWADAILARCLRCEFTRRHDLVCTIMGEDLARDWQAAWLQAFLVANSVLLNVLGEERFGRIKEATSAKLISHYVHGGGGGDTPTPPDRLVSFLTAPIPREASWPESRGVDPAMAQAMLAATLRLLGRLVSEPDAWGMGGPQTAPEGRPERLEDELRDRAVSTLGRAVSARQEAYDDLLHWFWRVEVREPLDADSLAEGWQVWARAAPTMPPGTSRLNDIGYALLEHLVKHELDNGVFERMRPTALALVHRELKRLRISMSMMGDSFPELVCSARWAELTRLQRRWSRRFGEHLEEIPV